MTNKGRINLIRGCGLSTLFVIWTLLLKVVDVRVAGEANTEIGFATMNVWFHRLTGVHMWIYTITDWLGLIPVFVCIAFGLIGALQLVRRKSLLKVDGDIICLGIYYVIVIFGYVLFEMIPINYRPILIEGRMEASYPSSTTLLVLSVMPTLIFQCRRRLNNEVVVNVITWMTMSFSVFMVVGRLIAGVHWFSDIVGAVLFSGGLFCLYQGIVLSIEKVK